MNFILNFGPPAVGKMAVGKELERATGILYPGLIFTFVWDLDGACDQEFVERACQIFSSRGAAIALVELKASLDVRLIRNRSPDRLLAKPSKRDLESSERNLRDLERFRLNSDGSLPLPFPHIVIENSTMSARDAAQQVIARLGLPRRDGPA